MTVDAGILASTRALIVPGTSLIVTDAPVNGDTHGTSDFRIHDDLGRRVAGIHRRAFIRSRPQRMGSRPWAASRRPGETERKDDQ